jgi:putative phosphoribosyl transferase
MIFGGDEPLFEDRRAAGRRLAKQLQALELEGNIIVLALPRGGVPVGYEIARALDAPLDIFVTRKIGAPGNPEFAIGAIASDGTVVLDDSVVEDLYISDDYIESETERQLDEVQRRLSVYRGDESPPDVEDRTVILVDDGVATGATVRASLRALRQRGPARLILAVPVGPPQTIAALRKLADDVVVIDTPQPFWAIGRFYGAFSQTTDDEVIQLLAAAGTRERSAN